MRNPKFIGVQDPDFEEFVRLLNNARGPHQPDKATYFVLEVWPPTKHEPEYRALLQRIKGTGSEAGRQATRRQF